MQTVVNLKIDDDILIDETLRDVMLSGVNDAWLVDNVWLVIGASDDEDAVDIIERWLDEEGFNYLESEEERDEILEKIVDGEAVDIVDLLEGLCPHIWKYESDYEEDGI